MLAVVSFWQMSFSHFQVAYYQILFFIFDHFFTVLLNCNQFRLILLHRLKFVTANSFRPFLSVNQKRRIFTHLPSTNLQTVICIALLDFFHLKIWVRNPTHPLHTFPILRPPLSARQLLKGLKIGVDGFSSTLSISK